MHMLTSPLLRFKQQQQLLEHHQQQQQQQQQLQPHIDIQKYTHILSSHIPIYINSKS